MNNTTLRDIDQIAIGARQWRVPMKTGETWIVSADQLQAMGSLGLSFSTGGTVVVVVPFGAFAGCEEIDPATNLTPHVLVIPKAGGEEPSPSKIKREAMICAVVGKKAKPKSEGLKLLLTLLPADGKWTTLLAVRAEFKAKQGGYPPFAYRELNEAVALGRSQGLVETTDAD